MKVKYIGNQQSVFRFGEVCEALKIKAGINMYKVIDKKGGSTLCSLEELRKGNRFKIIKED